jgi:hypothetical protein
VVVRVSTIYIVCRGVQPKEKIAPKIKTKTIVPFAAWGFPSIAAFDVPAITAKQTEQQAIETSKRGLRPILSQYWAPIIAAIKQITGFNPLINNCVSSDLIPAFAIITGR